MPLIRYILRHLGSRFTANNCRIGLCLMFVAGMLLNSSKSSAQPCFMADLPPAELQSLTDFYNNTGGPVWDNNYGWLNPIVPVDEWVGLMIEPGNCTVKGINISGPMGNNLIGAMPNLNLPNLEILRISGADLTGALPNFENLGNLKTLDLHNCHITGVLPHFLLPNLIELDLSDNNLSGNIPNFAGMPNLEELDLERNNLIGQIPDFSAIPFLETLRLHHNLLSGYIPNFTNLPLLEHFNVCPNPGLLPPVPDFNFCPLLNPSPNSFWCVEQVSLTGQVYYDLNSNCQPDAGEPPLANALILANGGQQYALANQQGFYAILADTGAYTLQCLPPNNLWQVSCTTTYTLNAANPDASFIRNFALQPVAECPLLTINIATPLLRRCFESVYTLRYCNAGTQPAANAAIALTLPPTLLPVWSSLPYTANADTLWFNVGAVNIGQCGEVKVRVAVNCNAPLGSAACAGATILPVAPCVANAITGYQLLVTGSCEDDLVKFRVQNLGADMPDSTTYRVYEDDILSALGKIQLSAAQVQEFTYAANGATLRMSVHAGANPDDTWASNPQAIVELCGTEPYSLGFVTTTAPPDKAPYTDTDCHTIIGSFDPNDKNAQPRGVGEEHFILPNNPIDYQINFQNTGNDTAFTVIVLDTLNADQLDFATLLPGIASHPYTLQILQGNILQFTFNNILLPDSAANQAQSHGFVQYSIRPRSTIAQGVQIINSAYIYFDYNQPVATPPVFHTICLNPNTLCMPTTVNTSITAIQPVANKPAVYCHPTDGNLYLLLKTMPAPSGCRFELYNLVGQQVMGAAINQSVTILPAQNLCAGLYVYRLLLGSGALLATGKMVK